MTPLPAATPADKAAVGAPLSIVERVAAVVLCALVAMALSAAMGRDLNWDYFNYHGYAAVQALHDRPLDYFAASYQGYLNPLPYLPFALMQAAGWHSLAVGCGLAALQSLNVFFLYLICRQLVAGAGRPIALAAVLTAAGAASSAFIGQLGSSFVDPLTTPPVMAALWLMLRRQDPKAVAFACALAGIATGLKLTNAPFALGVAAVAVVIALRQRHAGVWPHVLSAATGLGLGFLAVYGAWGWKLQQHYGSPLFPLFNQIFQAPDFPARSTAFNRFIPQDLGELVGFPLRLMEHASWIYTEVVAPDLRPAVVYALTFALGLRWLVVRLRRRPEAAEPASRPAPATLLAADHVIGIFFTVSLLAWLATSANGRYATPLLLLLGPLVYRLSIPLLGDRRAAMLALLVGVLQVLQVVTAGNPRWQARDWTAHWLPASVPPELSREPMLFLTIGSSSESYVAAHVHRDSVFTNPIGALSIATDGPGWTRLRQLLDRHAGRTRVQMNLPTALTPEARVLAVSTMDDSVERLDLTIDADSCLTLDFEVPAAAIPFTWDRPAPRASGPLRRVLNCAARPRAQPDAALRERRQRASQIMDAYEKRCPELFLPSGGQVEGSGPLWTRTYGKFDLFLRVNLGNGQISYHMARQNTPILIGRVAHWERDAAAFRCQLPHGGSRGLSASISRDASR